MTNTSSSIKRLSKEQYDTYWDNGFLTVRNILSQDEIDKLKNECRRLWNYVEVTNQNNRIQWRIGAGGKKVADRIDPVLDLSPIFQDLVDDERLLILASDIINAQAGLFKLKLISKWPGTEGYKMHQDYSYWNFVGDIPFDDFVTVLIPLDPFTPMSGSIEMFPKLHHHRLEGPAEQKLDVDESKMDLSKGVILDLSPGDISFFHSMTPHRSNINQTRHNRESLFITYVKSEHGNLYDSYYSGRATDFLKIN
jgi:ectoine hydroxylase-related dioxygenase (phytanoyl-CoA dioxygenase family)